MKIRFRSIDGKEVTKLEVPNPCTLGQLQRILLDHLAPSSTSSSSSSRWSVRFSLNRKDELQASSDEETLQSLGVASGDLLFYSLLPGGSRNPIPSNPERIESGGGSGNHVGFLHGDAVQDESESSVSEIDLIGREPAALGGQEDGVDGNSRLSGEDMDLDLDVDLDDSVAVCGKFSEPYFLRRVVMKELRGSKEDVDHRSLVLAVHAVMLDSGFICIDPVTKMPADGFHLSEHWPSPAFSMSLHYSFPEIPLGQGSIFLRFQTVRGFINVYGSLDNGKSDMPRVCLDKSILSSKIAAVLSNCDYNAAKGVFDFWKNVKDNLALPLSMNLSERAGLQLPSCFSRLPVELKAKVLISLSGVDLAKVACVCSELHYLSMDSDLWKRKCIEEFGERVVADHGTASRAEAVNWKWIFLRSWKEKKMKREVPPWSLNSARRVLSSFHRSRRDRHPFGVLPIIGGDYDRLPALGIPQLPGGGPGALPMPRNLFSRGVPRCNLGGGASGPQ